MSGQLMFGKDNAAKVDDSLGTNHLALTPIIIMHCTSLLNSLILTRRDITFVM